MTLLELTEPLFAFVCKLNRIGRKNLSYSGDVACVEITNLFDQMRERATDVPGLRAQFEEMELALRAFVDVSIQRSNLPFADDWRPISWDLPEGAAFEDGFFHELEKTLDERGKEARERMAVFYTCLGLGFTSDRRTLEQIDDYQKRLAANVVAPGASAESRISSPDDHRPDTRVLWVKLGMPLSIVAATVLIGLIALYIANVVIYKQGLSDLSKSLNSIETE